MLNRSASLFLCFYIYSLLNGCSLWAQSSQTTATTQTTQIVPAAQSTPANGFTVQQQTDRLKISLAGKAVAEFVFSDNKILRPYFSNLRLPSGIQVSRNQPPLEGVDAVDHATMHPGVWLAFGDISGNDFWRNKAKMQQVRFTGQPQIEVDRLTFSTECQMISNAGQLLGRLNNDFTLVARPAGWLLIWDATFHADSQEIVFGDQEEMGFGGRVATAITEKNGGRILNSSGLLTAKKSWGQLANWCDYSGTLDGKTAGLMLMAHPDNFRQCWWHNRDYGVFVANPFGRSAMQQGDKSEIKVPKGQSLRIRFGALVHEGIELDFADEFTVFSQLARKKPR